MTAALDRAAKVPRLGLSRSEVALAIGVCGNTVDQMVEEGFLPRPRRWHKRKVWLVAEIEAAMQAWPDDTDIPPTGQAATDEWKAS